MGSEGVVLKSGYFISLQAACLALHPGCYIASRGHCILYLGIPMARLLTH